MSGPRVKILVRRNSLLDQLAKAFTRTVADINTSFDMQHGFKDSARRFGGLKMREQYLELIVVGDEFMQDKPQHHQPYSTSLRGVTLLRLTSEPSRLGAVR